MRHLLSIRMKVYENWKKNLMKKKNNNIQLQKEFYSINDLKVNKTQSVLSLYLYPKNGNGSSKDNMSVPFLKKWRVTLWILVTFNFQVFWEGHKTLKKFWVQKKVGDCLNFVAFSQYLNFTIFIILLFLYRRSDY